MAEQLNGLYKQRKNEIKANVVYRPRGGKDLQNQKHEDFKKIEEKLMGEY